MKDNSINKFEKTKVVSGRLILHHPHLFTKWAYKDKTTSRYSVMLIIPKEDKETLRKIDVAIEETIKLSAPLNNGVIPQITDVAIPLRDGDSKVPSNIMYMGSQYMTASSQTPPGVINERKIPLFGDEQVPDCSYGRASFYFEPYNIEGKIVIACRLINVQVFKETFNVSKVISSPAEDFSDE